MLSIGQASGGYYASLAAEDYYTRGGEPPGVWLGEGAKALGLTGQVDPEQFLRLCDGYFEDEPLVQNAGKENHRSGWDLTFSAPKSVSVLWSQADPELRKEIQQAHFEAVKKALAYLEKEAAFTRRGKAGIEIEKCKIIAATFEHGTSRAQDPQLHTHAVVVNVGIREDGTIGTLETKPIYRHKMTAGALYRAELAGELQKRLSVLLYRTKDAFEIQGVAKDLIEEFSKRREAIYTAMKEAGAKGAERAAYFTVTTREKKEHIAREVLFEKWQETGKERNFSLDEIISQKIPHQNKESEKFIAVEKATQVLTHDKAYFTEKDLIRRTAEEGIERGLNSNDVLAAVQFYIEKEAIHLGRRDAELYYTTREIDALEKQMLSQVEASKRIIHEINFDAVSLNPKLNAEQKAALVHLTDGQGAIKVVSGLAGTGKTTLLAEARKVFEASGYEVKGAALAAVAAEGLQEGSGIKSTTVASTLLQIQRGKLRLTEKTVLVIDEAGTVGTLEMSRLIDEALKANAKLVLVGDEKQLQPIAHGAPFKAIGERLGRAELTTIIRQRDEWAREAVKDFAYGDARSGLKSYAERGLVTVTETRKDAMEKLLSDWSKQGVQKPHENLMVSNTRAARSVLNRMAQEIRKEKGLLSEQSITVNEQTFYQHDRVRFTLNRARLSVNNGNCGEIVAIDRASGVISVKLDSEEKNEPGKTVNIPTRSYQSIELGYAMTTHAAQGKTVENAFVLVGGFMQDREISYVQVSRTRNETRIYTERAEVGDTITELSKVMKHSRQKQLAQDVARESQQQRTVEKELSR